MLKNIKIITLVIICIVMIFALTGCGNEDSGIISKTAQAASEVKNKKTMEDFELEVLSLFVDDIGEFKKEKIDIEYIYKNGLEGFNVNKDTYKKGESLTIEKDSIELVITDKIITDAIEAFCLERKATGDDFAMEYYNTIYKK